MQRVKQSHLVVVANPVLPRQYGLSSFEDAIHAIDATNATDPVDPVATANTSCASRVTIIDTVDAVLPLMLMLQLLHLPLGCLMCRSPSDYLQT